MKSNLALAAASLLALSGCVTYDDGYRTTGHVGDAYGAYPDQAGYPDERTRIVQDRAGNVYRVYPDGTTVLVSRSGYTGYPYGYGGYSNSPYGYGGAYPSRGYPYGYGGYSRYGSYGGYSGPPRVRPLPHPGSSHPRPSRPTPSYPSQPAPNHVPSTGSVAPRPPAVGPVPPPSFRPRPESSSPPPFRNKVRHESQKGRKSNPNPSDD